MAFAFLHTADWQIGKPFRSFAERKAGVLEDARLTMIDRLAEAARSAGADHVLVAGDVFDAETLPIAELARPLEKLASLTSLTWHLLPGNHDPARPGGLWERIEGRGLPANVRVHARPGAVEIAPYVWLLPAPLLSRRGAADPTAWMDTAETPARSFRIGLAHGSVRDFGGDGEAEATIAPDRATRARLDYLALGDWHGTIRIDPRTWYAGTPEPDRFPDNEPGQALAVQLQDVGAEPIVKPISTSRFRWVKQSQVVASTEDLARLERAILDGSGAADRLLVRLTLSGRLSAAGHAALAAWSERMSARLFHLELDHRGLTVATDATDLEAIASDGELRRAADWLQRIATDDEDPRRADAEGALAHLFALAGRTREAHGA